MQTCSMSFVFTAKTSLIFSNEKLMRIKTIKKRREAKHTDTHGRKTSEMRSNVLCRFMTIPKTHNADIAKMFGILDAREQNKKASLIFQQ